MQIFYYPINNAPRGLERHLLFFSQPKGAFLLEKKMIPEWKRKRIIKRYKAEEKLKYKLRQKAHDSKRRLKVKDLKVKDSTIKIIQQIYENNIKLYGTLTCYLCLKPIQFGKDHLEHKNPISRGGGNNKENLDIACSHCNQSKHNKTEEEFRKKKTNV